MNSVEFAAALGITANTVARHCKAGLLKYEIRSGRYVIDASQIAVYHKYRDHGFWTKRAAPDGKGRRGPDSQYPRPARMGRAIYPGKMLANYHKEVQRDYPEWLTPRQVKFRPPNRNAERRYQRVDNGAKCHKCGGRVYDTPAYVKGVLWQCQACQRAAMQRMEPPEPMHGGAMFGGKSRGLAVRVREYIGLHAPQTFTELCGYLGDGVKAQNIRAALQGSRYLCHKAGTAETWEVKT